MVLIANGVDAVALNGAVALGAARRVHRLEAVAAVRSLVALKELAVRKAFQALAGRAARM